MTATLSNCAVDSTLTLQNIVRSSFLFMPLTEEFQLDPEPVLPLAIGPGDSYTIVVAYSPKLAGLDSGYFELYTDDPTEPIMQLDVSGVGISPPADQVGFTIKLHWDADETDVDSHLLAPNGTFFDCELDCHYGNPSPDWGTIGDWLDDPFLDVDDVDGYGPEHINISAPRPGIYTFVVHYYDDTSWSFGSSASNATVEFLSYGQVIQTFGPVNLDQSNRVWDVFSIEWPSMAITTLGNTYMVPQSAIQSCLPAFGFP
jgi:hypothetical protein